MLLVLGLALVVAVPSVSALIRSAPLRLAAVVSGTLFVFQAAATGPKIACFVLALVCTFLAAVRLVREPDELTRCFRPMLVTAALVGAVLATSVLVATANGATPTAWFRDALPYLLAITVPIVGLDASRDLTPRWINTAIILTGIFAAVGFAVAWLDRRGASTLGISRLTLVSGALTAMGMCYALAHSDRGRQAVGWLLVCVAILALMLVTGTRTVAIYALGFIGVIGRRGRGLGAGRAVFYLLMALGALVVIVPLMARVLVNDPQFLSSKIDNATRFLQGHAAEDLSYEDRSRAYAVHRELFRAHPWFGTGPGYTASLDTPWVVPAKLGVVGTTALVAYVVGVIASVRRVRLLRGPSPAQAAMRGVGLIFIPGLAFGPPEDKGLALMLALMLAAICVEARQDREPPPCERAPSVDVRQVPQRSPA